MKLEITIDGLKVCDQKCTKVDTESLAGKYLAQAGTIHAQAAKIERLEAENKRLTDAIDRYINLKSRWWF